MLWSFGGSLWINCLKEEEKNTPVGLGILVYPQSQNQSKRDSNFSVFATKTGGIKGGFG